ncbi:methyltransferase [Sphingomonas sp.]|uniref:class I SAM-dependent methyltransferase n=1 Tax=Sphingomonas sp. TaxID=28214 RepID=UPI00286CDE0E|nr:methyltransferase [Sphingomonas sp.]
MKATTILLAGLAFGMSPTIAFAAPNAIAAAVAAPSRTPDNVKLDEGRKPAEVLDFFGLKKGMRVIDMFGANQYWAEMMAPVVGPRGKVVVWQPTQFINDERRAKFAAFVKRQKNVSLISSPFEAPELGTNAYDFMIMNLDYHDVYWQNPERKIVRMEPDAWLKTLYAAMKPGATVGIIDHVALPNADARATVQKLHRIDPEVLKADFQRAGFELVGVRNFLRNPADDHTLLVFDPVIRGKTDRIVYRFRKPR